MTSDEYTDKAGINRVKTLDKLYKLLMAATTYSSEDCRHIASMIYYIIAYRHYRDLKDECLDFVARLENS